jgi:glycosyltransferase involved in cell wall biosynthesis
MPEPGESLSVVVPVYRSEGSLEVLVQRLAAELPRHATSYELILVNDGSPDDSWKVVERLAHAHRFLRGISLTRNFGQHNALLCGIRAARGEVVVTMDDDLQNPPEEIGKLLAKLREGYDVVYGVRDREAHGLARNLASVMTKLVLQKAMGADTARRITAYRAFRTELRTGFANYTARFVSIDVLLTWSTSKFTSVEVEHRAREIGASNYTVMKLVTQAVNLVTGFSVLPLQAASVIGFACMALGFSMFTVLVVRYLVYSSPVQGFTFLATTLAFFSGVQLLTLGIIGEYLARMYSRTMGQPSYVVRHSTDGGRERMNPELGS